MKNAPGHTIVDQLRSGDFLDRARICRIASIFFALSIVAFCGYLATSKGGIDYRGRPLSADYFAFWSAGNVAVEAGAEAAYDHIRNRDFQLAYPGNTSDFFLPFWSPPIFLLLMMGLAAAPYLQSWAIFSGASAALYFFTVRRLAPAGSAALLIVAAAPGVWSNVLIGQSGLLLTALFAGGLFLLDRRPLTAGLILGLITIKPQYGVLIPFFLVALGRWKTFLGAAISVAAQALTVAAFLGWPVWQAFFENGEAARAVLMDQNAIRWEMNLTVYAWTQSLGIEPAFALAAQIAFALVILALLVGFWRSTADLRLKMAALPAATLLMAPYSLNYDLILLAPSIALIVSERLESAFRRYEKVLLALAWVSPVIAYPFALVTKIPLALIVTTMLVLTVIGRKYANTSLRST